MYHSLSYYKIYKKWKIQRRKKKNTNLNYPKLQNGDETTLKLHYSLDIFHYRTPWGIYRHQGKGRPGANPGPKYGRGSARTATEMRLEPCAALSAAWCPSVPCRLQVPVSGFGPLVLTKLLSKVNGYIIGL